MVSEEKQQRRNHPHRPCEQRGLLWEDGDHLVALRGNHPLPCVLLAVDLVFHKEVSFLLEVGATVAAHVALGVTLLVPDLHKHPSGEGTSTLSIPGTIISPATSCPAQPHTTEKVDNVLLLLTGQSMGPTSGQADVNGTLKPNMCWHGSPPLGSAA